MSVSYKMLLGSLFAFAGSAATASVPVGPIPILEPSNYSVTLAATSSYHTASGGALSNAVGAPVPYVAVSSTSEIDSLKSAFQYDFAPNPVAYSDYSKSPWSASAGYSYQFIANGAVGEIVPLVARVKFDGTFAQPYTLIPPPLVSSLNLSWSIGNLFSGISVDSSHQDIFTINNQSSPFMTMENLFNDLNNGILDPNNLFDYGKIEPVESGLGQSISFSGVYQLHFNVYAGYAYDITMSADATGYNLPYLPADSLPNFGAAQGFVDPYITIDQTYLADHPQTSLSFSLGAGNANPDEVSSAPEPVSWAFMIVGFGAIGGSMRHRRGTISFA